MAVAIEVTKSETPAAAQPHQPALDGVRGVAILLVMVFHISGMLQNEFGYKNALLSAGELGWTGVDLFFVLSGYLITGILYDSKNAPHYYRNFYARRALRIFPLYYLAMVLIILARPLLDAIQVGKMANPAELLVYATNYMIGIKDSWRYGIADHFWSLAVEEHFYLIWPTFVFFLDRKRLMIAAAAACAIALAFRLASVPPGSQYAPVGAYVFTHARMDALAAGAFIALAARGPNGIAALFKPAVALGAVAFAAFAAIVILRHNRQPYDAMICTIGLTLLWLGFGGVLVAALNWRPLTALMSAPVLRWFGKYSYGLYVWQLVCKITFSSTLARSLRGANTPLTAFETVVVTIAVILALTMASWHLWEKRFLRLKTHFDN